MSPEPETPPTPSNTEIFVRSILGFPSFVFTNALSLVLAFITDWETFILLVGASLVAYATGAYLLVGGALAVTYSLLRVFSDMAHNHAQATSLHARIIRDNPGREQRVAITQLPMVITQATPPQVELADEYPRSVPPRDG